MSTAYITAKELAKPRYKRMLEESESDYGNHTDYISLAVCGFIIASCATPVFSGAMIPVFSSAALRNAFLFGAGIGTALYGILTLASTSAYDESCERFFAYMSKHKPNERSRHISDLLGTTPEPSPEHEMCTNTSLLMAALGVSLLIAGVWMTLTAYFRKSKKLSVGPSDLL